jgi:hypothetical protein
MHLYKKGDKARVNANISGKLLLFRSACLIEGDVITIAEDQGENDMWVAYYHEGDVVNGEKTAKIGVKRIDHVVFVKPEIGAKTDKLETEASPQPQYEYKPGDKATVIIKPGHLPFRGRQIEIGDIITITENNLNFVRYNAEGGYVCNDRYNSEGERVCDDYYIHKSMIEPVVPTEQQEAKPPVVSAKPEAKPQFRFEIGDLVRVADVSGLGGTLRFKDRELRVGDEVSIVGRLWNPTIAGTYDIRYQYVPKDTYKQITGPETIYEHRLEPVSLSNTNMLDYITHSEIWPKQPFLAEKLRPTDCVCPEDTLFNTRGKCVCGARPHA